MVEDPGTLLYPLIGLFVIIGVIYSMTGRR